MEIEIRQPSAWIPIAISLAALTLVLGYAAIFGVIHQADEGAAAHMFQLLIVLQAPFAAYFALQVGTALAAMVPVYCWKL